MGRPRRTLLRTLGGRPPLGRALQNFSPLDSGTPGEARPRSGRTTYVGEGSVFGAPEGRRLLRTRLPGASAGAFFDRAGLLDVVFQ